MVHHVRKSILAGVLAAFMLVPAATASARTFERTFPSAANLCARVAAGNAPAALNGKESLVQPACADLQAAFDAAETALSTKLAALDARSSAARAAADQACRTGTRAVCRNARAQLAAALFDVFVGRLQARFADRQALTAASAAFRAKIDEIRTGPVPPPVEDPGPIIIS